MGTVIIARDKNGFFKGSRSSENASASFFESCSAPFSRLPARQRRLPHVSFNEKLAPGARSAYIGVNGVYSRL
ncbi:hypothetical protein ANCDUO_05315 [Ancylostoma duodenale]|uniref:Uncharacterized protein n=1 Tax=Ancylostoma duodenale TaxID=51022 RepID=A0A0C2H4U5_9BILA|nr:hypothetical protein ANCDUO_05315 [Ancylostoma duodenale]